MHYTLPHHSLTRERSIDSFLSYSHLFDTTLIVEHALKARTLYVSTEVMTHSTEYAEAFASIYFTSQLVFESGCPTSIYTIRRHRKMKNIGFKLLVYQRETTNQETLSASMGTGGGLGADQSEARVGTKSYYGHQQEEPCLAMS